MDANDRFSASLANDLQSLPEKEKHAWNISKETSYIVGNKVTRCLVPSN